MLEQIHYVSCRLLLKMKKRFLPLPLVSAVVGCSISTRLPLPGPQFCVKE